MEPEPFADALGFTALAVVYIFIFSKYYFPPPAERPQGFPANREFIMYYSFFFVLGVLVPATWMLAAPLAHKAWALHVAGPHLFLLIAQIIGERVLRDVFAASNPACIMVAALYSARRTQSLYVWVVANQQYVDSAWAGGTAQQTWLVLGQVIAVANFLAWGYNLFFFLLPRAIPDFVKGHYEVEAALSKKES